MSIKELYKIYCDTYSVSTDTRTIEKGSIFFALKGDNFNGNKFVSKALEQGAAIVVIDEKEYFVKGKTFLVENVLLFLQKFANYHRKLSKTTFIGITGTNGKTTSKELLHQVLSEKYRVISTKGNFNNHIGVPLTLLSVRPEHDIAIVEMGANHQNEIAELCKISLPDFGYITNFGKAHLEGFGSFEGIVKTKTELYKYLLSIGGICFINPDDEIQLEKSKNNKRHLISDKIFYEGANPFVYVNNDGMLIKTNLIGNYNFQNIRFAISVGEYFGVSKNKIKDALESFVSNNNRSQIVIKDTVTIILDAYNANPTSMKAAISNISDLDSEYKIAILGDMFELGEYSLDEHKYIADELLKAKVDEVFLIGEEFDKVRNSHNNFTYFSNVTDFIDSKIFDNFSNSTILIKGSRGMKMEDIIK